MSRFWAVGYRPLAISAPLQRCPRCPTFESSKLQITSPKQISKSQYSNLEFGILLRFGAWDWSFIASPTLLRSRRKALPEFHQPNWVPPQANAKRNQGSEKASFPLEKTDPGLTIRGDAQVGIAHMAFLNDQFLIVDLNRYLSLGSTGEREVVPGSQPLRLPWLIL